MRDDDLTEVTGLVTDIGAALRVDVSPTIIRARIRSGRLPSQRLAGRRAIHPADLEATQTLAHVSQVVPAWRRAAVVLAGGCASCGKQPG